ncbi:MAG: hypothetical protein RL708_1594 [Bacteroidota bacterium]|jgi:hypothetical protein
MKPMDFKDKRTYLIFEGQYFRIVISTIILLSIINLFYFLKYEPTTIGLDFRYYLLIVITPILIGSIAISILYRKVLIVNFSRVRGLLGVFFTSLIIFFPIVLVSFLGLGLLTNIFWNTINKTFASKNEIEYFTCTIIKFKMVSRSPNSIVFYFKNKTEDILVNKDFIEQYSDKNPKDYCLSIQTKKGLWDSYLIKSWELIQSKNH